MQGGITRPRAIHKEATVVTQGWDHPLVILTPAQGTHSDPSLHILPTVVRHHFMWEFHLSEYDSEYREKPKGLCQSQIYCHHLVHEPRSSLMVVTHIPDRILTRLVI